MPGPGPPPPLPPDPKGLPPAVGRVMRAISITIGQVFESSQAQNEEKVLYGLAASKGVYEGPARRISGPSEFGRIAKGDVLVTASTTEAFNILLPLLGGIVTARPVARLACSSSSKALRERGSPPWCAGLPRGSSGMGGKS